MSTTPTLRDAAQAWTDGFEAHRKWIGDLEAFWWDHATDEPGAPSMPANPYRAALTQGAGESLVDKSPDLQGSLVDKTANLQGQAGEAVEPFGYWHQGETYEESDFFAHGDMGNVACEKCITLVTAQQLQQAVARALEELKFHPQASHVEPNYRDWFNKTIDAAIRAKGTHD